MGQGREEGGSKGEDGDSFGCLHGVLYLVLVMG
jgi:hypothetical protein